MSEKIEIILLSLLLIAAGVLFIGKPEWVWYITESWKSRGADGPSEWFEAHTRLGGIAFLAVGMIGLLAAIFLL